MIKYTILYKNGKTWNGKAETRADIMEYCWNLIKQKRDVLHVTWIENDGDVSVVWPRLNYTGAPTLASSILCSDHYNIKPTRTPNPASVTKKQKAFDKAYAEWKINNSNLVDYDDGSGYMKYAHVGNGDTSIKAYKKWLWEQKQAELKSVLKETSLDEFVKIWDGVYRPWKEAAIGKFHHLAGEVAEGALPITLKLSYDVPIKTTYTFWLGQDGSISDEL